MITVLCDSSGDGQSTIYTPNCTLCGWKGDRFHVGNSPSPPNYAEAQGHRHICPVIPTRSH